MGNEWVCGCFDFKEKKVRSEQQSDYVGFPEISRTNELFEKFYKNQNVVENEEEWRVFLASLRAELPVTFRISGSVSEACEFQRDVLTPHLHEIKSTTVDGDLIPPPRALPWYPNQLAWEYEASRKQVRKSKELSKFHSFLVAETDVGNICRQEAVSMIPPLLLDVHPHHHVLDMCAAPGSKTAQLVDLVHPEENGLEVARGLVVANDVDYKRCYTLVHQVKRLQSPCLLVTNHDSTQFPRLMIKDDAGSESVLRFDRVLADVPCSGDGTLRKNPLIWRNWTPRIGAALHRFHRSSAHPPCRIQLQILIRGLQLLKSGGRLVYSTCSLNPLENEAVLAECLRQHPRSHLSLLDAHAELPALLKRRGMRSWQVMNKDGEWLAGCEEGGDECFRRPSLFPPSIDESWIGDELEHSIRILPHDQNTGAFFIAVIQKNHEFTSDVSISLPHAPPLVLQEHFIDEVSDVGVVGAGAKVTARFVVIHFATSLDLMSQIISVDGW